MADTPKIKLMSNLNLNDNSFIIKDTTRITFPDNPIEGIECLVNGINYIYTILDGFLSWIPTSINRETKNFTIEPAEQNWVISHNWNTDISKLDIICYNSDNKVITGNIAQIDKNSFSVAFSSAVAGRITLFNSVGAGSGLTPEDRIKLDSVEAEATKNKTDGFLLSRSNHTGTIPISVVENLEQELANISTGGSGGYVDLTNYYDKTQTDTLLSNKVDKVVGKGLSTNDFTDTFKQALELKKVQDISTDSVNKKLIVTYTDDTVANLNINDIVTDVQVSGATLDATTNVLTLTSTDGGADVTVDLSDFVNSGELTSALSGKADIIHSHSTSDITGLDTTLSNLATNLNNKQDTLVSGTNIKTINGQSVLGSGNLALLDATNPIITGSITEQVYNLTGTEINPTNGTIQYKTVSANTTFTESLTSGQSVILRLIGANGKTITFPTITWIGVTAPTLTANCAIVLWKEQSTLYGAYVGSLV